MKLLKNTPKTGTKNNHLGKWIFSGIMTMALTSGPAAAAGPEWGFDQPGYQTGQSVQLPSLVGTTPSAAAPVIVVQATNPSGYRGFDYKEHCWVFSGYGIPDAVGNSEGVWRIGAGKVESGRFTGIMALYISSGSGAGYVMQSLTNSLSKGSGEVTHQWCGVSASCAWNATRYTSDEIKNVIGVSALRVSDAQKCYP